MARSRNIKPGFFKNELLGTADPLLSLLFASLWCLADRDGRLEDRPLRIKAETFPYRDAVVIDALLADLERLGFITRYQVDGLRLIQVNEFHKHQNPHHTERASQLPGIELATLTVKPPPAIGEPTGGKRSDSLIPDSPIPDPPIQPPGTPAAPVRARKKSGEPSATSAAWDAYALAYERRYGEPPVRNAAVNGRLAQLVARLGAEAPAVAAFYVSTNAAFYVRDMHGVGLLLRDCEKLRTQWATGRTVTEARARQVDRTATVQDAFADLIEQQQRREGRA